MTRLRLALAVLALTATTGCGGIDTSRPPRARTLTDTDNIRRVEGVELRGKTYDCIVYDRKSAGAGMGGLWCDERGPE